MIRRKYMQLSPYPASPFLFINRWMRVARALEPLVCVAAVLGVCYFIDCVTTL